MASNTPTLIRTSERGAFKRCEFAWDIEFNRRLRPVGPSAPALRFGSLIHMSLEKFYKVGVKRGPRPAKTFEKLYDAEVRSVWDSFQIRVDDEWASARDLGIEMLTNYYDLYGKDEEWEVLATEQTFKVPLITSKNTGKVLVWYVGTMDGIWRNRIDKKVVVADHKTAKSIDALLKILPKDDQAGSYWTFGVEYMYEKKYIPKNLKLNGMLYNIMAKRFKDERPKNEEGLYLNQPTKEDLLVCYEDIERELPAKKTMAVLEEDLRSVGIKVELLGQISKNQPGPLFHRHKEWRSEGNRRTQRRRAQDEVRSMLKARRGKRPLIKKPSMFSCGSCPYEGPCELHEAGQDYEPMLASAYQEWDPYDAHEIYAGR